MLLKMAICTVWHEKEKLSGAVVGVALGVFLVIFQWGLYFAYKRDTTLVLDAFDADIWIVPKNQSMFDGFSHMDDLPYWRAKETPGVQDVARIVWGDAAWRIPSSGGKDYVQVLGIDLASSLEAHFRCHDQDVPRLVRPDGHVLIGTKDREKLGVAEQPDGPFEISGRQTFVVGFVDDVRLFTTAGFVLTDVDNARAFLRLPSSHVNYIVCKCRPHANVPEVVQRLRAVIPEHTVLTTRQFHDLCSEYWETISGIGPLILLSSVLGVTVGFLIVILTFYISTLEKIPVYACLKALGGTAGEIAAILGVQVLIVFLLGSAIAGVTLCATMVALRNSMISLLITLNLIAAGLGTMLACSACGALLSIRRLFVVDPGEAFRT
jgi:putative ABC transport system permease protein